MRKLLVASQKSGVGKTTTSINLAAAASAGTRTLLLDADPLSNISTSLNLDRYPHRQPLRSVSVNLPGILYSSVVPGLDVLSPYEEGGCSDEDFDNLLHLVASAGLQEDYGCLIVDSPPFMGTNPGQLLGACDDLLLVMRAEPMAYRTLPAFLELVQRSRRDGCGIQMRGILLTLPDGELPGGRWERELRGRFGTRILPQVIPYDEEMNRAFEAGQILSHSQPDSPAAVQYHALAAAFTLTSDSVATVGSEESPLLAAALQTTAAPVMAGRSAGNEAKHTPTTNGSAAAEIELPPKAISEPAQETILENAPSSPGRRLLRSGPNRPAIRPRPVRSSPIPSDSEIPDLDELLARQALPGSTVAPIRPTNPAKLADASASPKAAPAKSASTSKNAATTKGPPPAKPTPADQSWLIWVCLAIPIGVGLRYVQLPDYMLSVAVGVAVAIAMVLVLRLVSPPQPSPPDMLNNRLNDAKPQPREAKKPASGRPEAKKDPNARLAALARYPGTNRK